MFIFQSPYYIFRASIIVSTARQKNRSAIFLSYIFLLVDLSVAETTINAHFSFAIAWNHAGPTMTM